LIVVPVVTGFLAGPEPTQKPVPVVVLIGGNECACSGYC
jgi:hypothetical protein